MQIWDNERGFVAGQDALPSHLLSDMLRHVDTYYAGQKSLSRLMNSNHASSWLQGFARTWDFRT